MKSCLTGAGTADYENIFVDIVLGILISAHHDTLGLSEQNILVKLGVDERLDVIGVAPSGAAVLHAVAVFLGIFGLDIAAYRALCSSESC